MRGTESAPSAGWSASNRGMQKVPRYFYNALLEDWARLRTLSFVSASTLLLMLDPSFFVMPRVGIVL